MPTLRADENRYLLQAEPWERGSVRRIPGCRWTGQAGWQFPRQPAVVLALDRVFGEDGWRFNDPATGIDVDDARERLRYAARPQDVAVVRLEGPQLAVRCSIADKELVKLVPGYRWSPGTKSWYVAAVPMALDILQERFGDRLDVDAETRTTIELRRADEQAAIDQDAAMRARMAEPAPPPPAPPVAEPPPAAPPVLVEAAREAVEAGEALRAATPAPADATAWAIIERLDSRLDRLASVLERLEAKLAPQAAPEPPPPPAPAPPEPGPEPLDWRELLRQSQDDAAGALDQANRTIQASSDNAVLRAVAGVAAHRAGRLQQAYEHLSQALRSDGAVEDANLSRIARDAFQSVVLRFLNDDIGPIEPIENVASVRKLLLAELYGGNGFRQDRVSSTAALGTLQRLVGDPALKRTAPELADFCRVAHLVATVRGGGRMVAGLVAGVLREEGLHPDAQALAILLYANVLHGVDTVNDWVHSWPREFDQEQPLEAARLVELALRLLPLVDKELAPPAALSTLACVALADEVSLRDRRQLAGYAPRAGAVRHYAEFLALYRAAASGERAPWSQFPGYAAIVANSRLDRSWQHLQEVFMAGSGPETAVRLLADDAYLPALKTFGVTDPRTQVIDLLDLLRAGSRPDNLLNELGQLIEDGGFEGAALFDRDQRIEVYRAAFDAALAQRHDIDARDAFHRLVRELQEDGDSTRVRDLCAEAMGKLRRLKVPALAILLETQLEEGADIASAMDSLAAMLAGKDDEDRQDAEAQLQGLQFAYPEFGARVRETLTQRGTEPALEQEPSFPGRSVVIVGGREYMRKRAMPVLERWDVRAQWLTPGAAKQGDQAVAAAAGSCDIVVVNTACIGHAASIRTAEAAQRAGKEPVWQHSNGVGTMLQRVRRALEGLAAAPPAPTVAPAKRKSQALRKRAGF
ncbi:MAG: DUF2325 domain-containing protein [Dehalococcoidia bacterium]|nr:DUF2325 domain-containing protein [Dehalococcoidia bacterium]